MLVVIDRDEQNKQLGVLDTDDMVVEYVSLDKVKRTRLPIYGLTFKRGIRNEFVSSVRNAYEPYNIICDMSHPSYFDVSLFKVYGSIPAYQYNTVLIKKDMSSQYWFDSYYMAFLERVSPLSLLSVFICVFGGSRYVYVVDYLEAWKFVFDNIELPYNKYGIDTFILLYLSALYDYKVNDNFHNCLFLFKDDNNLMPKLSIMAKVEITVYNNTVYFCDKYFSFEVPLYRIENALKIHDNYVFDTKNKMLGRYCPINLVTGNINVDKCKELVVYNNNHTYVFDSDYISIKTLKFMKGAKFSVNGVCKLGVDNLYIYECFDNVKELADSVLNNKLNSYYFTLEGFNRDFFYSWLSQTGIFVDIVHIGLLDKITRDNMLLFVRMAVNEELYMALKSGDTLDTVQFGTICAISRMKGFELLSSELQSLLNSDNYKYNSGAGDTIEFIRKG